MYKAVIWIVLILVCKAIQDEKSVPYVIPVNIFNIKYIKLNNLGSGIFSAPPLALLDIPKLSSFSCFINIRTRRYALGIPIIFWNSSYIDYLNSQRLVVDNSGKNIIKVIPPSNISKFQINWRRPYIQENGILLDSSWYDSELNYILPMSQTFIMEFDAGNSSKDSCNQMKNDLISIPTQRQELEIKFRIPRFVNKKIPEVTITTSDICSLDPISSICGRNSVNYGTYVDIYIYSSNAHVVAYNVATNLMKRSGMQMIELQEEIRKLVFSYLCRTQLSYSSSYTIIGLPNGENSEAKVCLIQKDVIDDSGIVVRVIDSITIQKVNNGFSLPILNIQ